MTEASAADDVSEDAPPPPPPDDEPAQPIDRQLFAESRLYGVAYKPYLDMSPRERGAVKARWAHKLKAEARRRNIDPDEFLSMDEDQRDKVREEYPERHPTEAARKKPATAPRPGKTIDDVAQAHIGATRDVAEMVDEGLTRPDPAAFQDLSYDAPPTEADPRMRQTATLGEVTPVDNADLLGWTQPKNLRDIYSRWTIGDGQHFIRVERIDPRVWQQIPTAGYIGEIREAISEEQFHAFYGGRAYRLQVYGPDPKGRMDPTTGLPVIKPKTDPFPYNVPMLPPNLLALPGRNPGKQQEEVKMLQSPFQALFPSGGPAGMPATPADATMHKTTVDFFSSIIKRGEEEREELRRAVGHGPSDGILKIVQESSHSALEQATRSAEARERTLVDSLNQARDDNKALAAKLEKVADQQNADRGSPVKDAVTLMQTVNPAKTAEDEVRRLRDAHTETMTALKTRHDDELSRERIRHDDELKRLRDRLDDADKLYKSKLDDIDRVNKARERELKDEIERVRTDERAVAERRVQETVARFDDRIKDLREQHGRELRMQTEQHTTRVDTTKGNLDLQIANMKERIEQLKEELSEAKEQASEAGDPVQIIEKAEKQAKQLGWTKKDDGAPQTAGERFAATAGMGLSKALETMNDWVPKAIAAARQGQPLGGPAVGGPQQRALGQGQQAPQGQAPGRPGPSKRAVSWASQGSVPVAGQQYTIPPDAPAAQPMPQQQVVTPQQPAPAAEQQAQPVQEQPAAQPQQAPAPTNGAAAATTRLGRVFPDEIVVQFRTEVERAINTGFSPEAFAQRFLGAFPEPARLLVSLHKPEDLVEVVQGMPDGAESPILRRDGKRWVEQLWQQLVMQASAQVSAQPQA